MTINTLFANNATTTLASGITNVATSLTVSAGTGIKFPSPTGAQYFYCTIADAATGLVIEIVKVTARSTDTFTIVRAQEGTTASAYLTGDIVEVRLTAAGLNDPFSACAQLSSKNTLSNANTLSNKDTEAVTYLPGTSPYSLSGQTGKYANIIANPSAGSSGGRESDFYIKRDTNYIGGTAGDVNSALHVEATVRNAATSAYEWATNFTMISSSNGGEHLANASFAFKYGQAAVWGSNILAWDKTGSNIGNGLSTLELNMFATGADQVITTAGMTNFGSRNVVDIVVGKNLAAEGQLEIGSGIRMIPFAGDLTAAKLRYGIDFAINCTYGINFRGTYTYGIDMSSGTYNIGAIKLGSSKPLVWDTNNSLKSTYNGSTGYIEYTNGGVTTYSISPVTGNVKLTSDIINSAGNIHLSYSSGGYATTTWTDFTLLNSWVNFGGVGNANAGYYKDALGIVHLRGVVKSGTITTVIATLPAGYRPQYFVNIPVVSNGAFGFINIDYSTGNFAAQIGSNVYVCLDGISFKAV